MTLIVDKEKVKSALISIDFDGVITSPHEMKSNVLRALGYNIPPEHTDRRFCIENYDLPTDAYEYATFQANCFQLMKAPLARGALNAIDEIKSMGLDIAIVTSRRDNEVKYVYKYLSLYGINDIKVYNTNRESKIAVLSRLMPLVFVDDALYKLVELGDLKDEVLMILLQNDANRYSLNIAAELGYLHGDWEYVVERIKKLVKK